MKNRNILILTLLAAQGGFGQGESRSAPLAFKKQPTQIQFEKNIGQFPGDIAYVTPQPLNAGWFKADSAHFVAAGEGANPVPLTLRLGNGGHASAILGEARRAGARYYLANRRDLWDQTADVFSRIRYKGIYRGVDLVFHSSAAGIEYDFELASGADPAAIQLSFDESTSLEISPEGELLIHTAAGTAVHGRPISRTPPGGMR
jgi:hypothetical protein